MFLEIAAPKCWTNPSSSSTNHHQSSTLILLVRFLFETVPISIQATLVNPRPSFSADGQFRSSHHVMHTI